MRRGYEKKPSKHKEIDALELCWVLTYGRVIGDLVVELIYSEEDDGWECSLFKKQELYLKTYGRHLNEHYAFNAVISELQKRNSDARLIVEETGEMLSCLTSIPEPEQ